MNVETVIDMAEQKLKEMRGNDWDGDNEKIAHLEKELQKLKDKLANRVFVLTD